MFQNELEALRDRYNEERQSPLLPRNMPPVSGRIIWIRHFYKRITEPMEIFKTKQRVSGWFQSVHLNYSNFVAPYQ